MTTLRGTDMDNNTQLISQDLLDRFIAELKKQFPNPFHAFTFLILDYRYYINNMSSLINAPANPICAFRLALIKQLKQTMNKEEAKALSILDMLDNLNLTIDDTPIATYIISELIKESLRFHQEAKEYQYYQLRAHEKCEFSKVTLDIDKENALFRKKNNMLSGAFNDFNGNLLEALLSFAYFMCVSHGDGKKDAWGDHIYWTSLVMTEKQFMSFKLFDIALERLLDIPPEQMQIQLAYIQTMINSKKEYAPKVWEKLSKHLKETCPEIIIRESHNDDNEEKKVRIIMKALSSKESFASDYLNLQQINQALFDSLVLEQDILSILMNLDDMRVTEYPAIVALRTAEQERLRKEIEENEFHDNFARALERFTDEELEEYSKDLKIPSSVQERYQKSGLEADTHYRDMIQGTLQQRKYECKQAEITAFDDAFKRVKEQQTYVEVLDYINKLEIPSSVLERYEGSAYIAKEELCRDYRQEICQAFRDNLQLWINAQRKKASTDEIMNKIQPIRDRLAQISKNALYDFLYHICKFLEEENCVKPFIRNFGICNFITLISDFESFKKFVILHSQDNETTVLNAMLFSEKKESMPAILTLLESLDANDFAAVLDSDRAFLKSIKAKDKISELETIAVKKLTLEYIEDMRSKLIGLEMFPTSSYRQFLTNVYEQLQQRDEPTKAKNLQTQKKKPQSGVRFFTSAPRQASQPQEARPLVDSRTTSTTTAQERSRVAGLLARLRGLPSVPNTPLLPDVPTIPPQDASTQEPVRVEYPEQKALSPL